MMVDSNEYFNSVSTAYNSMDMKERFLQLERLIAPAVAGQVQLTDAQILELEQMAIRSIAEDKTDTWDILVGITLALGNREIRTSIPALLKEGKFRLQKHIHHFEYMVDLLLEAGYLPTDEKLIYFEQARMYFANKDSWRTGYILLTDRRIIHVGFAATLPVPNINAHRLYYDDWEERPYLSLMDFIDYERISNIESFWKFSSKTIYITYDTKFIQEKGSTVFGPYFFKWDIPKSAEVKEGKIKLEIDLSPIAHKNMSKFSKRRQEMFVEKLRELSGV